MAFLTRCLWHATYEHGGLQTKLFALSDVPITQIFSDKKDEKSEITQEQRLMMEDLVGNDYATVAAIHELKQTPGSVG
jgi:hypothetical protein